MSLHYYAHEWVKTNIDKDASLVDVRRHNWANIYLLVVAIPSDCQDQGPYGVPVRKDKHYWMRCQVYRVYTDASHVVWQKELLLDDPKFWFFLNDSPFTGLYGGHMKGQVTRWFRKYVIKPLDAGAISNPKRHEKSK